MEARWKASAPTAKGGQGRTIDEHYVVALPEPREELLHPLSGQEFRRPREARSGSHEVQVGILGAMDDPPVAGAGEEIHEPRSPLPTDEAMEIATAGVPVDQEGAPPDLGERQTQVGRHQGLPFRGSGTGEGHHEGSRRAMGVHKPHPKIPEGLLHLPLRLLSPDPGHHSQDLHTDAAGQVLRIAEARIEAVQEDGSRKPGTQEAQEDRR